jgi:hypothetical protein
VNDLQRPVRPLDAFDENSNKSIISKLDPETRERVKSPGVQRVLEMSDEEVDRQLRPSLVMKRLRTSWWLEYDRIAHQIYNYRCPNPKREYGFKIDRAIEGICTEEYFREKVLSSDVALGYIMRPPADYIVCINEALQHGVQKLREILDFPLWKKKVNNKGVTVRTPEGEDVYEPDHRTADIILKAFAMIDLRAKGAIAQKLNIEGMMVQKNMNVNIEAGISKVTTHINHENLEKKILSIDNIDARLQELSAETRSILEDPMLMSNEVNFITQAKEERYKKEIEDFVTRPIGN